jgi:hypothetical protein
VHVVAIHYLVFVANDLQGIAESCMKFFDNKHAHSKLHMKNVCLFERETEREERQILEKIVDIRQSGRSSVPIPF